MARNGSGTYSLVSGNPVVTNTTISSTWANNTLSDIATALTQSLAKDGQTVPTANLPLGGFKFTGLGAGAGTGDSLRYDQLFSQGNPTDIASAANVDIGSLFTNFVNIAGTTTITSLGTNYNGPKMIKFTGILLLTYNATTLVLPTSANITTAVGDTCIAIPKSTSSGTADGWQIIAYQRANGLPLGGTFASAGANSDITSLSGLTTPLSVAQGGTGSALGVLNVPTRQTVISGPTDTGGFPTFLPATSASLVLATQNVSTGLNALVATASSGSNASGAVNLVGSSTANLTWPACTASNTNYLPVSISGGTFTTQTPVIIAPIYQWGGTPAVTNHQYTFNIQTMTMYLGDGTTANIVDHVIVGECVAGASTITSSIAYAYQRRYFSGWFAVTGSTSYAKSHNLGIIPSHYEVLLADDAVGTNARPPNPRGAAAAGFYTSATTRNSTTVVTEAAVGLTTSDGNAASGYYGMMMGSNW
ncbi:MAG: hypothetical protein PHT07_20740 [Paludibacter sp.]|nr:hypothetical protein [Paludibacter sp.]